MNFTIELMSSQLEQFTHAGNDLNAAERQLIQQWSPCFNVSQNIQPTSIPSREAERSIKAEDAQLWPRELE